MATPHAPDIPPAPPVAVENLTLLLIDRMNAYHHKPYELPGLAQQAIARLPALQAGAPENNPTLPAYEVGTLLMRKAREDTRAHDAMADFLISNLPSVAKSSPSAAHGLFRAVLDAELEPNPRTLTAINMQGFAWHGGRLSPARGGAHGHKPTLVIYPFLSTQLTMVDDDGFKGPLNRFAMCARRAYLRDPVVSAHYRQLFKDVQTDLSHRQQLPTFRQAAAELR